MRPRQFTLRPQDYPEGGPWFAKFLRLLDEWQRDVAQALNGGIEIGDNTASQLKTIRFTTANLPLRIATGLRKQPLTVMLLCARRTAATTDNKHSGGVVTWKYEAGTVTATDISALSPSIEYECLFWVVEG